MTNSCVIDGAESALYTPVDDDLAEDGSGFNLHVLATYTDKFGKGKMALGALEGVVQEDSPDNTAPVFPDQDLSTPEDESESTTRTVEENKKAKQNIGEPITASDTDSGDLLLYTLGGPDKASFDVAINNGQLKTKAALDYETKSEYEVTVTATDPSGATDKITVMITVIDKDEGAKISLRPAENVAPAFADDVAEFMVYENMADGTEVGMVMATDETMTR